MSGAKTVEVAADEAELRLDRWFRRHFPGLGHGRLEKLLRTGQVRVDGARAKGSTRLAPGQRIRVPPLGADAAATPVYGRPAPVRLDRRTVEEVKAFVIHRDEDVLALNKPPGLAVQGGTGLVRHLDAMLDALKFGARDRPRLVHRLDRDTSGVLLLGRTPAAAARLAAAFRSRAARKIYWALVVGVPRHRAGRIDRDLAKTATQRGERVVGGGGDEGKHHAVTDFAVLDTAGDRVAWLVLRPLTGRTHQIRVHCAEALGTPILGDGKYGGRAAFLTGVPQARKLHLHARAIEVPHPRGGTLRVVADLPPPLAATWAFFGFSPADAVDPFV